MKVDHYRPAPDHPLYPYLDSIWSCQAQGAYTRETILPMGVIDIIFNFADPVRISGSTISSDGMSKPGAYLGGTQTAAITSLPVAEVNMFGISIKIEGCSALLPLPTSETTDILIDASLVFKNAGDIIDQIYATSNFAERCGIVIRWLISEIRPDPGVDMIRSACHMIGRAPSDASLDRVASELNMSSRHLRRLFLKHLGVGPSQYLRLSRFVGALHMMSSNDTLTEIAHAANYFDQAHFCRDFKTMSGITPTEYREQAGRVPGHLFAL